MRMPAGSRFKKTILDVLIILISFIATVAVIYALFGWIPGVIEKWPEVFRLTLETIIMIGPIFAWIGVIYWRLHKPRPYPLRLEPITSVGSRLIPMAVLLGITSLALVIELVFLKLSIDSGAVVVTLLVELLFFYFMIVFIPETIKQRRFGEMLERSPGIALARIHRTYQKVHSYADGDGRVDTGYTYHAILEFTPLLSPSASGNFIAEAQVSESLYDKLMHASTVNVRYAVENPRIFLIEGE